MRNSSSKRTRPPLRLPQSKTTRGSNPVPSGLQPVPTDQRCARPGCRGLVVGNHGEWKCLNCGAYYIDQNQQTVEAPRDVRVPPKISPTEAKTDLAGVDPSDREWLAATDRERKHHQDSRSTLTKTNHWLRWECLRRSVEYQQEWARLEEKYQSQPSEERALSQWRETLTATNQFAYRGQDEAFAARRFGLYDLYQPDRTFPITAPPTFIKWPAAEPADQTLIDLYRCRPHKDSVIPESPVGLPFLTQGRFLIIANFGATKEELVDDVLRLRQAVIGNKRPYTYNPLTPIRSRISLQNRSLQSDQRN